MVALYLALLIVMNYSVEWSKYLLFTIVGGSIFVAIINSIQNMAYATPLGFIFSNLVYLVPVAFLIIYFSRISRNASMKIERKTAQKVEEVPSEKQE